MLKSNNNCQSQKLAVSQNVVLWFELEDLKAESRGVEITTELGVPFQTTSLGRVRSSRRLALAGRAWDYCC